MWSLRQFLTRRRRPEADFSDEIAAHLALEADRLVAEGRAPADAEHEARRRFGNVGHAQEAFHERRAIPLVETLLLYARRAVRRLAHAPVFSVTAALTLMLGIGATTAVFSLVNAVLLRPLPFAGPERLVDLSHSLVLQGISHVDQSDATYLYYRAANHVFENVGAYRAVAVNLSMEGGDADRAGAQRAAAARVSASLFAVLGVPPLRGRVFSADEDRPSGAPAAILSEWLWRSQYGADPAIIGRVVWIDGVSHQVVGIMPSRFAFPTERTALWLPVNIDAAKTASASFDFRAIGRLRRGVTVEAATADLQELLPHVPEAFPGRLTAASIGVIKLRAVVRPLRDTMIGEVGRTLWVVLGAAAALLLIACANVANLFLVRAEERQHELAVRRALGAGRGTIVAEFLAEGLVLSAVGGLLGLGLAAAGVRVLRSMDAGVNIPRLAGVGMDGYVLAVATGVTVLAALVMSLVPALRSGGAAVSTILISTGRSASAGRVRHRARRLFVVVQVALALVLITGAGLMVRSFQSLRAVTPGFVADRSWTFRIALPAAVYPTTADATVLLVRALDAIAELPGVQAVGVVSKVPLDDEARKDTAVFVEDRPLGMGVMPNFHPVVYATEGSFAALGTPLVEGRTFARPDPALAPLEVIVTRALAARYWGDSSALGRRLRLAPRGPLFTIVGVTGDVRGTRLEDPPDEMLYLPLVTSPGPAVEGGVGEARWLPREVAIVVRGGGNEVILASSVERTIRALAPAVPVYDARSMSAVVARATARTAFTLQLLGTASMAALLIGAVGLYGVVSYMVSLRSREMAVRIALGAQPSALRRLVLRQAVAVAAVGVALGLAASFLLMRFLASLLFGVAPTDPMTLAGAVALMAAVAVLASWLPARRAAAMDPALALRTDC